MAAIITDNFRRKNAKSLVDKILDAPVKYYVGLGRSNPWSAQGVYDETSSSFNVVDPTGTVGDEIQVLDNLTSLIGIQINQVSQVIPNIPANVLHRHKAFDPYDPDCFYQSVVEGTQMYPCYTIVGNNVYLCLRTSDDVEISYSMPAGGESRDPLPTLADGSVWIYLYTYTGGATSAINGQNFIIVPAEYTLNLGEVKADITLATGDLIFGFKVLDRGSGYVSAPTVQFISDAGVTTTLIAIVDGGEITKISYVSPDPSTWVKGPGYVKIATGNARAIPMIAPVNGFGYAPASELCSWYVGIKISADPLLLPDIAYSPYRQVSIIHDPKYEVGVTAPTDSLHCLKGISFGISAQEPTSVTPGDIITQPQPPSKPAIGIADYYDADTKILYYHQTLETGTKSFTTASLTVGAEVCVPDGPLIESEYVKRTGQVIFTENRNKITRVIGQNEQITIILQF